jgi:hypothetical protein
LSYSKIFINKTHPLPNDLKFETPEIYFLSVDYFDRSSKVRSSFLLVVKDLNKIEDKMIE